MKRRNFLARILFAPVAVPVVAAAAPSGKSMKKPSQIHLKEIPGTVYSSATFFDDEAAVMFYRRNSG